MSIFNQNVLYFDYEFDYSEWKIILMMISKNDIKIGWNQEIMISLRDPINDQYILSFNYTEIYKSDWKTLDEWNFDCNNEKSIKREWIAQWLKSIKNGDKIKITKNKNILHFVQYINKCIIVRDNPLIVLTNGPLEVDLEKFTSATEIYFCTWNKIVLKSYILRIYDLETKFKNVFCGKVERINDFVFLCIFFNIFPSSTINMVKCSDTLNTKLAKFEKPYIKRFEYYTGMATIQLNKNLVDSTNFTIKFRSLVVDCKEFFTNKRKSTWTILRFPRIISIECAQLCDCENKNVELIDELIVSIAAKEYSSVSIEINNSHTRQDNCSTITYFDGTRF